MIERPTQRLAALAVGVLVAAGVVGEDEPPATANPVEPVSSTFTPASVDIAVLPVYPRRAMRKKIDGEVTVSFTITKYGRARDIEIVGESPRRVFGNATVDAMKYWVFHPARPVACGTVEQKATQTFRYRHAAAKPVQILPIVVEGQPTLPRAERALTPELERLSRAAEIAQTRATPRGLVPLHRVEPTYPDKALERRKEGVVAVSFLIEKDGTISSPQVVDTVQGGIFKASALRALRQWRFEPKLRDGVPVEQVACHEFLFVVDEYLYRQREREMREQNILVSPGG